MAKGCYLKVMSNAVIKLFPLSRKAILYNIPLETFKSDNSKAKDITPNEFI